MNIKDIQGKTGLRYVLDKLEILTPFGNDLIKNLKFYEDEASLKAELSRISFIRENPFPKDKENSLKREFMKLKDLRASFERIANGTRLTLDELFEVKGFLMALGSIYDIFGGKTGIEGIEFADITKALDILDPQKERKRALSIPDSASEKLAKIREEKRRAEKELFSDRTSAALRAKWDSICADEDAEEKKICAALSLSLQPFAGDIIRNAETAGKLDLLLAKAKLEGTVVPEITGDGVAFSEMTDPEIKAAVEAKGHDFIPVSFAAKRGTTAITGANMGGKSVALKTLALNVCLAMTGFPVFAAEASLPLIPDVNLIYEDFERSSGGLSSFAGEMVKIKDGIEALKSNSLLLLDEPARGTNPQEGAAIVKALAEFFKDSDAFIVMTTHFDGVANLAAGHYRIKNYALQEADPDDPIPKEAVDICRKLGFSEPLVEFMRKNLGNF